MRLVLDATPLTMSSGGLARYTADLAVALAGAFPEDEYWLASDQPFALPASVPPNLRKAPGPESPWQRRWWMWGLPRMLRRMSADVFHGTHFAVPYLPACPSVMTVPDLSPWLDPAWHSGADRVRRRTPMLLRLGLARRVLTFTEAVRREVTARFRLPAERVKAVPLAAREWFAPVKPMRRDRPYFLFVGTLEPRKNVQMLIEAWRPLRGQADLVLIGRRRADGPALPEEAGLHWEGEVADAVLPAWYCGALAFVYPSLYEGFGLPVLEAMQCGACVITSTDASIAEVAGDACLRLDARQPAAWTEAMRSCAAGGDRWAEFRRRSPRQAALFSWARTARRTREVYADALVRPFI
jgi:glycosyltransferase involved in cell wall biosynthesis